MSQLYITRVAVGMEFEYPSPSHSHRISVEIPTKTHRNTHKNPQKNPQKPTCGNTHRLKVIPIPIPYGKTHRFPFPRQPCILPCMAVKKVICIFSHLYIHIFTRFDEF